MKIVEKDKNQAIMQRTAKRLLIIFLVLIFLLSFLSRAADSVTVPRVVTRNPEVVLLPLRQREPEQLFQDGINM